MTKVAPSLLFVFLWLCVLLWGGLQGCGKKADPQPSYASPPPAVAELKSKIVDSGIVLSWGILDVKGINQKYKILRSEMEADMYCPDCPSEYNTIVDISLDDPSLLKQEGNRVSYLDSQVKAGFIYTYRIIICDIFDHCSEPSQSGAVRIDSHFHQKKNTEMRK